MWISIKNQFRIYIILLLFIPLMTFGGLLLKPFQEKILNLKKKEQSLLIQSITRNSIDTQIWSIENILELYSQDQQKYRIIKDTGDMGAVQNEWKILENLLPRNSVIYYGSQVDLKLITSSGVRRGFPDYRDTQWFKLGSVSGELNWTDPYISEKNSEIVISAVIGITDKNSVQTGVLGLDIPMKAFFSRFKTETHYKDEKILAVLEDKRVINFNRKINEPIEYNNIIDWETLTTSPAQGMEIYLNDTQFYTFSTPVNKLGIHLLSLVPSRQIKDEIAPIMRSIILILVLCYIFAYCSSYLFVRKIVSNIVKLNSYMNQITQGNYSIQNCVTGRDEFQTLNQQLNTMVETLSLNITQLQAYNSEMKHLIKMRTTLLHIISHNTSTPITILINNAMELLEEDQDREDYKQIFTASGNLKSLMENTMVYLKLDEGQLHSNNEILDLNSITEQICQMYHPLLKAKSITIKNHSREREWIGNYFLVKNGY